MATFVPLLCLGQLFFLLSSSGMLTEGYGNQNSYRPPPFQPQPCQPQPCQPQPCQQQPCRPQPCQQQLCRPQPCQPQPCRPQVKCPQCPTVCDNSQIDKKCSENVKHLLDKTFMDAEKWGNASRTEVINYNNAFNSSNKLAAEIEALNSLVLKLTEYQKEFEQTVMLKGPVFDKRVLEEYKYIIVTIFDAKAMLKENQSRKTAAEQKEKH